MTDWAMESTEHDLNRCLGDFLRRRTTSAKDLARRIGCEVRTAEGFRAGRHWPSARHWKLIAQEFGRDVLAAVFEAQIDETLARLRREERELEERLDEVRARRRQVGGPLDRHSQRLAPPEDRQFESAA